MYIKLYEPNDLIVKPIIEGPICPIKPLSEPIDIIVIFFFFIHVRLYLKDNLGFLRKCSYKNIDSSVLVPFYVKRLYKSIPINYGIEAINFWIEAHSKALNPRFSKIVLESTKTVLQNNIVRLTKNFKKKLVVQPWLLYLHQQCNFYSGILWAPPL